MKTTVPLNSNLLGMSAFSRTVEAVFQEMILFFVVSRAAFRTLRATSS